MSDYEWRGKKPWVASWVKKIPCSRFMSGSWVAHHTANKSGFMSDFMSGFMSGSWWPQSRPLMIKRISMPIPLGFQLGSWLSISYILQNSWSFQHGLWWMLLTFLHKLIVLDFDFVLPGVQTISKSGSKSDHMIYVHGCFMSDSWATHEWIMSGCPERFPQAPKSINQKFYQYQLFLNLSGWLAQKTKTHEWLRAGSWVDNGPIMNNSLVACLRNENMFDSPAQVRPFPETYWGTWN